MVLSNTSAHPQTGIKPQISNFGVFCLKPVLTHVNDILERKRVGEKAR